MAFLRVGKARLSPGSNTSSDSFLEKPIKRKSQNSKSKSITSEKDGFDVVIGNPPYVQIQKFSGQQIQKDWEKQKYLTFAKTGDIYCLFYEKGHQILRERGVLAFITSNKWMRANYGKKLRQFFGDQTTIEQLIDFGDAPIFSEATTYTNILLFEKANRGKPSKAWDLSTSFRAATSLERMLEENPQGAALFSKEGVVILPPELAAVKQRIEETGTPLKEWDITINYGIKTGFNKAFIIDGKKRDKLIARDPKSAEILKPILRGRDIKRYKVDFADLWLIFIPWHFPLHNNHTIAGASKKAEQAFKDEYPAIYHHIMQYMDKLTRRNKAETGIRYEWYALQRCAATYYQEFKKEKIIWMDMSPSSNFALSSEEIFVLNTSSDDTSSNMWSYCPSCATIVA
ncbi:MAG: class I SAM-dependent DNA methyltransferase [Desulfosarcina sp.]|nr:class I SAM-dependent DNA methyltransferase [Desulfosarcina sp.]MBC2767762.1 class I SAM-dependent DNA methyltransferase [Desulfosarcina sp.]